MKTRFHRPAATLLILTAVFLGASYAWAQDPTPAQQAVVTVNGKALTQEMIDKEIQQQTGGDIDGLPPEQLDQFKQMVVDNFIAITVLEEECTKEKISVTPQEVDETLAKFRERAPEGMTFEEALKKDGMSIDDFKEKITNKIKRDKLIADIVKDVPAPTDAELQKYYEQKAKAQIKARLEQENKNEAIKARIEALKSKATIVYGKK